MSPHDPHDGATRRRNRPALEGLESRDLPSSQPIGLSLPGRHLAAADVQQFVPVLYPPGTPQPTPAEVQRESFVNKAVGQYEIGPGRFDTQSLTIFGYGKSGGSNLSQKTRFQYLIFEPTDTTNPVYGEFNILAANSLNSGANIILDVLGPTGSEVHGLPTHLNWVHDISSGVTFTGTGTPRPGTGNFPGNYINHVGEPANPAPGSPGGPAPSSVANWNLGYGDLTFKYVPDVHPLPGSLGSGKVIVVARGLLNTSGAQSSIEKNYN